MLELSKLCKKWYKLLEVLRIKIKVVKQNKDPKSRDFKKGGIGERVSNRDPLSKPKAAL